MLFGTAAVAVVALAVPIKLRGIGLSSVGAAAAGMMVVSALAAHHAGVETAAQVAQRA
jgi:hypothetical protein